MALYDEIIAVYPELANDSSIFTDETNGIILQNDSDGVGDYIKSWNYSQPVPTGLTVGKPAQPTT